MEHALEDENVDGAWHDSVENFAMEMQDITELPSTIDVELSTHGVFGQHEITGPDFFHANIAESSHGHLDDSTLEQQAVEQLNDASSQGLVSQQNIMEHRDFLLCSKSPSTPEVHELVLSLSKQFEQFGGSGEFLQCQVKKKPPDYSSLDVQGLEAIMSQTGDPRFSWKKATFIIDHPPSVRNLVPDTDGVQVNFCGPSAAVRSDEIDGQVVWRIGGCGTPTTNKVKPWKFWLGDAPKFYVCMFVPFTHRAKRSRKSDPGSEGAVEECSGDHQAVIEVEADELVEKMFQRMKLDGRLTESAEGSPERIKQETNYRKSLKTTLHTLMLPFTPKGADQRWADDVFEPNYPRLSLDQVFDHIDRYGHLPWIRSEKAVRETGVNLVEDHVDQLAAVEHLYLYFRERDEKQSQPEAEQEQLQVLRCENMCPEARELSMLPDAERLPALRRKNREFISRVFAYSKLSPKRMCPLTGRACPDNRGRIAAVAKQIVEIVGGGDYDVKGISALIRNLGADWEEQAFMIASEAVNRCAQGLVSKQPCGKITMLPCSQCSICVACWFITVVRLCKHVYCCFLRSMINFQQGLILLNISRRRMFPPLEGKVGSESSAICPRIQQDFI